MRPRGRSATWEPTPPISWTRSQPSAPLRWPTDACLSCRPWPRKAGKLKKVQKVGSVLLTTPFQIANS